MQNTKLKTFKYLIIGGLLSLGINDIFKLSNNTVFLFKYIKSFYLDNGLITTISFAILFVISSVILGAGCEVFLSDTFDKKE